MSVFDVIAETRKAELLEQLRWVWTRGSTAIEGIALSLGDARFVFQCGLTVMGKRLKNRQGVFNHVRAVDRVMSIHEHGRLIEVADRR